MVRVDYVIDSWKTVREDTAAAVEDFPEAEFDFRPPGKIFIEEYAKFVRNLDV